MINGITLVFALKIFLFIIKKYNYTIIDSLIQELPKNLNAEVVTENDEIEVILLEADELWSYVGSKENPQWLWLVMHSKTRQVVAMQVGARNKQTAEKLF